MPKINKEPSGSNKAESILIATTDGETVYKSDTKISDLAAGHSRSHTMVSTLDHTATAWRIFYSDASGDVTELALGTNGQVLASNGATSAPSFQGELFTSAEQTKLANIETLADVTDTANVTSAGALMDSEVDADIKTLVLPANTTISGTAVTNATGTPVNDQVAVWTDATTLEGSTGLTKTATQFTAGNFTFNIDQSFGAPEDNYVLVYNNGTGEIGLEAAGAGAGDVVKVGTPVNNEIGIWTGDGTIKGLSGQIPFPATQNASADANTLDDYEEGTWTPTIQDSTESDAEGQTYGTQVGQYVKIGRLVYITGHLNITSTGTLTGGQQARIAGLPFTSDTTGGSQNSVHLGLGTSLAITAGEVITGVITSNQTVISLQIWNAATGTTACSVTEISTTATLYFSGSYLV